MTCKRNGKHKGHNILLLEEAKNSLKMNIERYTETIEINKHILQNASQKATKELSVIQGKKEQTKEFIRQHFEEIRMLLKEKEIKMMNAIEEIQTEEDKLSKIIIEAQNYFTRLSSTSKKAETILSSFDNTIITPKITCDAISITKGTIDVNDISRSYNEISGKKTAINLSEFERDLKTLTQSINNIKEVKIKRVPTFGPKNLIIKSIGPFLCHLNGTETNMMKNTPLLYIKREQYGIPIRHLNVLITKSQ